MSLGSVTLLCHSSVSLSILVSISSVTRLFDSLMSFSSVTIHCYSLVSLSSVTFWCHSRCIYRGSPWRRELLSDLSNCNIFKNTRKLVFYSCNHCEVVKCYKWLLTILPFVIVLSQVFKCASIQKSYYVKDVRRIFYLKTVQQTIQNIIKDTQ